MHTNSLLAILLHKEKNKMGRKQEAQIKGKSGVKGGSLQKKGGER